jgi:hypothetical protein
MSPASRVRPVSCQAGLRRRSLRPTGIRRPEPALNSRGRADPAARRAGSCRSLPDGAAQRRDVVDRDDPDRGLGRLPGVRDQYPTALPTHSPARDHPSPVRQPKPGPVVRVRQRQYLVKESSPARRPLIPRCSDRRP